MRFDRRRGPGRETYHHGNLREVLIEMALGLIAEKGPRGIAIAELARASGVSPAAPYRHFRDLDALIAEIARRGFERFADELEAAWDEGRPDPVTAIETCGAAYLRFARREPAYYATMFDRGADFADEPGLRVASDRAFGVLRRAADLACKAAPADRRPPGLMVALHIWALSHGIASLFIGRGGPGDRYKLPMPADDLLEAGLLIYLQSLGLERA